MTVVSRVLVVLVAMLVSVACSSTKICTALGCSDQVTSRLALDRALSELGGGSVRVCIDDDCTTATIEVAEAGVPTSELRCSGGASIVCSASPTATELALAIVRTAGTARDGEVFEVTVLAPTGETAASRKGTVEYARSRPNGPDCEPECAQGELK